MTTTTAEKPTKEDQAARIKALEKELARITNRDWQTQMELEIANLESSARDNPKGFVRANLQPSAKLDTNGAGLTRARGLALSLETAARRVRNLVSA